ncbi:hypothetical protein niasHT_038822 [Heterodera trifolii]|uniref:Nematode cuticle collagen N-terminal domain-containing protein n=2 Tax=Heterodera trifolii TaxID=157864 RepID=A0ABD2HVK8_9BILA
MWGRDEHLFAADIDPSPLITVRPQCLPPPAHFPPPFTANQNNRRFRFTDSPIAPLLVRMSVNKATVGAIALSGSTLLVCLFGIASIYSDIQAIWNELDMEMDQFKMQADDLWKDMLKMGAGTAANRARREAYGGYQASGSQPQPSPGALSSPQGVEVPPAVMPGFAPGVSPSVNSAFSPTAGSNNVFSPFAPTGINSINNGLPMPFGQSSDGPNGGGTFPGGFITPAGSGPGCKCKSRNTCPVGPAGPPGDIGPSGVPGIPGKDGIPGQAAEDSQNAPLKGCFNCPAGPTGTPGTAGRPGIRGMRGPKGYPGQPGRDGVPGLPGEQGQVGENGLDGRLGPTGFKGKDEEKQLGRKGPKGAPGEQGIEGPRGASGNVGPAGPPGLPGPMGAAGYQGTPGNEGEEGREGAQGRTGPDAAYCPCPNRYGHGGGGGGGVHGRSAGGNAGDRFHQRRRK